MDSREVIRNMLNNIINDKHEEATLDFHSAAVDAMKRISGINSEDQIVNDEVDAETSDESTEEVEPTE